MEEFLSDILGKMAFNLKVAFGDWRQQIKQSKVPGSGDAVFQPQRMRVAPLRVEKSSVAVGRGREGGCVGSRLCVRIWALSERNWETVEESCIM